MKGYLRRVSCSVVCSRRQVMHRGMCQCAFLVWCFSSSTRVPRKIIYNAISYTPSSSTVNRVRTSYNIGPSVRRTNIRTRGSPAVRPECPQKRTEYRNNIYIYTDASRKSESMIYFLRKTSLARYTNRLRGDVPGGFRYLRTSDVSRIVIIKFCYFFLSYESHC